MFCYLRFEIISHKNRFLLFFISRALLWNDHAQAHSIYIHIWFKTAQAIPIIFYLFIIWLLIFNVAVTFLSFEWLCTVLWLNRVLYRASDKISLNRSIHLQTTQHTPNTRRNQTKQKHNQLKPSHHLFSINESAI